MYNNEQQKLSSNLTDINGKAPTDLTYISAFIPRIADFIGTGQSANLLNDITYIINTKGILSGAFGYSNRLYIDKPMGITNWGYVEYSKHADSYVTVKLYSEINNDIFIGQFILGESTWSQPWKKVQYNT